MSKEKKDKEINFDEKRNELKNIIDKLYFEKKLLVENSKKCYKSNKGDEAKYLSDKAKDYQNRIDNLENYYSDLTFYSNNIILIDESLRIIDVRGLYANESIKRIEKRKRNLKRNGDLCVVVGILNKSIKNELNISDLGIKIIEYLKNNEKCKFEINQPIKGRILIHYSNTEEEEEEKEIIKSLIINTEFVINKINFTNTVSIDDKQMKEILKEKESLIKIANNQREEVLSLQSEIDKIKQLEVTNNTKVNYKEERSKLISKINDLNKQASLNFYKGYNLLNIKRNENIIDLHGQYVNESLTILEEKLSELKDENELIVIYGSGIHSVDNIQKIKPKILELLIFKGYEYKEIDNASLVIFLNSKST